MRDKVTAFIRENGLSMDTQTRYIDLVSEIGELGKEILKPTDYGKRPFVPNAAFRDEMGDCLFSLLALCDAADIDAETALDAALAKYKTRLKSSGSIGSSKETELSENN